MKKIINSIVVSSLLLSFANADSTNNKFYGSMKVFKGSGTEEIDVSGSYSDEYSESYSFHTDEISFGIGRIFANNNRVEFNYNTMDDDVDSFGVDYIISADKSSFDIGDKKVTPQFSVGARYYKEIADSNGFGLKIGIGLSMDISKEFEAELGYEYHHIEWEDIDTGYFTEEVTDTIKGFRIVGRYKF